MFQPFDLDDLDDTPIPPFADLTETRLRPRPTKVGPLLVLALFVLAAMVGAVLGWQP